MTNSNILIGQSGGPTAVINATLAGAIKQAQSEGGRILGLPMGLEGMVNNHEPLDLTKLTSSDLEKLAQTSGMLLGSSRVKPDAEKLETCLDYIKRHEVRYFIFIGGNGSLQTPLELQKLAQARGYELCCVGAPKTIDNDLVATDHAPGYGSAARWIAQATRDAGLDLYSMRGFDNCKILETMGRHCGWLAAAASLARYHQDKAPHLILLPEVAFEVNQFLTQVEEIFRREGCVLIVAAEGVRDTQGRFLAELNQEVERDAIGKAVFSVGEGVSGYLCQLIKQELKLKARYDKPGTLQRGVACVSEVDRAEAFALGQAAMRYALSGQNNVLPTLQRSSDEPYQCEIEAVAIEKVIGREKRLPPEFLAENKLNETVFSRYAAPLIGPALPKPFVLL